MPLGSIPALSSSPPLLYLWYHTLLPRGPCCTRNSLKLANEHKLKTIAFPAISTGVYGYPIAPAAEVRLFEKNWKTDCGCYALHAGIVFHSQFKGVDKWLALCEAVLNCNKDDAECFPCLNSFYEVVIMTILDLFSVELQELLLSKSAFFDLLC